jgi:hypothetical protein
MTVGAGDTEDGGVCGIPVRLLLPGRLWLGKEGALPRLDPRLLHFPPPFTSPMVRTGSKLPVG